MHVQRRAVRWRFIDSGGGARRRPRHRLHGLHGAAFGDGEPASGSRSLRRRKVWRQAAPVTCDTDDFESGRFVVNGHLGKRGGDAAADRPPERRGVGPGRPAKEPAWTHLPPGRKGEGVPGHGGLGDLPARNAGHGRLLPEGAPRLRRRRGRHPRRTVRRSAYVLPAASAVREREGLAAAASGRWLKSRLDGHSVTIGRMRIHASPLRRQQRRGGACRYSRGLRHGAASIGQDDREQARLRLRHHPLLPGATVSSSIRP